RAVCGRERGGLVTLAARGGVAGERVGVVARAAHLVGGRRRWGRSRRLDRAGGRAPGAGREVGGGRGRCGRSLTLPAAEEGQGGRKGATHGHDGYQRLRRASTPGWPCVIVRS